jgi:hypothetical protein
MVPDSARAANRISRPAPGRFIAFSIDCFRAISGFFAFLGNLPQNSRSGGVHCKASRIPSMLATERLALAFFFTLVLAGVPVRADDAAHPAHADATQPAHTDVANPGHAETEHACLNQKERRTETESGKLIRLSTAMRTARRRMPGTVVRARLCHGRDGLVYVLTVLAHDGKVAQIAVDAVKGTFTGGR